jgi:chemotaxis-related protein WspD
MTHPPDSSALPTDKNLDARQLISCWRDIGISGDRSCPELLAVTHCHNCPTYTQTARQLFDRPQSAAEPERQLAAQLEHRSSRPAASSEVESSSLGLFRLNHHWFALPAHLFQQVVKTRLIRPIPHRTSDKFQGLVNIQGELLLCINLKNLLNLDSPEPTLPAKTIPRLIIVEWENDRWSFVVDEFQGIESISPHQLITPPSTVLTSAHTFTHSLLHWNNATVNCLDEVLLFKALECTVLS